jgi:hypothetical protein
MADRDRQAHDNLGRLADRLIARHLRLSVPDSAVRDRLAQTHPKHAYPFAAVERRTHCIAVVGAGASAPLLKRADALADELEATYGRDEAELDRLKLVNGLKRNGFETRLIALSRTPAAAREVRQTIAEQYSVRHPALLGYELLAHLLKHRFLDAIVSFNFDELLDQSLEDELDPKEFLRIVSERDCGSVEADTSAPGYLPLYVKLHGTASEPESLRFTPDSYYALPPRVVEVVRSLLHVEHCVIVNIGSSLGSFDFQRLLREPKSLEIFNLSHDRIAPRVVKQIDKERSRSGAGPWLRECVAKQPRRCDRLMEALNESIEDRTRNAKSHPTQLVQFRSALRHKAVVQLLGVDTVPKASSRREHDLIDYTRRRAVLELALAGAKSRGLLSLGPLATDRPSRYYDQYRRLTNGNGEDWRAFCSAAGLVESQTVPDILLSEPTLRVKPQMSPKQSNVDTHHLQDFDADKLARHVLARVRNPASTDGVRILRKTINELQTTADTEIHTHDDRVCSKAFRRPVVLPTATALRVYTWLMLQDLKPEDEVYISSETGEWLLSDPIYSLLKDQQTLRLLVAFTSRKNRLARYFPAMKVRVADPWRHNRHMTIVCDGDRPARAVYFARRLRTPVITPVYVDGIRDVQRLATTYAVRWDELTRKGKRNKKR